MSDRSVLSPDLLGFLPPESVEFTDVCVGRGGSGIVHRGWYKIPADGDRIEVAIKALAPGATDREIRQFQKEYTIHWTASKKCPGACVLFGCVHRGTDLCLVMKLYTGGSLHELLDARRDPVDEAKRQPLSVDETVAFALPLAKALSQLHHQNVVCNDLKPGNVLRDADGSLVISDFGLATILERTMLRASTTRAAEGGGTAPYMAPEQHDSESFGRVSAKTDVWAFGCIVLEMLTGEVPWAGMRPMEIMMNVAVKKKVPSIPHGLPEALLATLRGCFVHDQAGRFSSDDAILALEPLAPASRSVQTASGEGGDAAESRVVQMMQARLAEFEQRFDTQEVVIKQLHAQVTALTQQLADHSVQTQRQFADTQKQTFSKLTDHSVQTQRQIADTQKQVTESYSQAQRQIAEAQQQTSSQADVKLGNLSRQLQDEMQRQIDRRLAKAGGIPGASPAVAAWLQELDQELQEQQQEPQPEPEAARIVPKVAARSAAVTAGGTDPLTAAMEQQGLTAADQAVLVKGGVTTLERFSMLTDDDYTTSRIDIAARRSAKAEQAFADAQGVTTLSPRTPLRHPLPLGFPRTRSLFSANV